MSQRNTLEAKRARKRSRTLRKGVLPTYVDLIGWMKLRANLTTTECRKVAMSGALRVDSHKVGILEEKGQKLFQRYVPTALVGPAGKNIQIGKPDA